MPSAQFSAYNKRVSYKPGDTTMYMICDSGCTAHFLCTSDFFIFGAERPTSVSISGLGGHTCNATSHGYFHWLFKDINKFDVGFTGFGVRVPDTL
eukprot:2510135-Rhodomonas_salina.1